MTEAVAHEDGFAELVRPHRRELHAHCWRLPTLAQVADAAVFLASDRAGAITGTVADLACGTAVRTSSRGLVGLLD